MQVSEFRRTVSTFADPGTDLLFEKSKLLVSVHGSIIEADISTSLGDVLVDEGDGPAPASKWITTRLAQLPLLAARLRDGIAPVEHFVSPAAKLLPTLERVSDAPEQHTTDALASAIKALNSRSPLETTVLYLTSDAGEGKTALISQMARLQADSYIAKRSDWLLVPIPLGGRHFLRFDDIAVGVLQNRYRFPFLYYQSLLELVRMGVVVPAFDGFEEMFVESSSGEALSAMGMLVGVLDSRGAIVMAARRAYFDFESLRTQERLFDTIRTYSVGFCKLELQRWGAAQFKEYCTSRSVSDVQGLYNRVSDRLGPTHALLTRAVLVRRLVDVATSSPTLDAFLLQLQKSGPDFFAVFVRGLIEREAAEKWLDRTGENDLGTPLLSTEEHVDLLSQVALAMWESRVDYLGRDGLEFVADYFCESTSKIAQHARQIRERIRGHAMLVPSQSAPSAVEFDHDEFRHFFLGEGAARALGPMNERATSDALAIFRRGVLPRPAQHSLIRSLTRDFQCDRVRIAEFVLQLSRLDAQASYTHENCSDILIRVLSGVSAASLVVKGLVFTADSLRDRKLSDVKFEDCYFAASSLELSEFTRCDFVRCKFAQLRPHATTKCDDVLLNDSSVDALVFADRHHEVWDPTSIRQHLEGLGITVDGIRSSHAGATEPRQVDDDVRDIEKLTRYFMRSTHMSESVIMMKLGVRGKSFIDNILPLLLRQEIFHQIENLGSGTQRRFRLGVPLQVLNAAIVQCDGSLQSLLSHVGSGASRL